MPKVVMPKVQQSDLAEAWLELVMERMPVTLWVTDGTLRVTRSLGPARPEWDPGHPVAAAHRRALAGETTDAEVSWSGATYDVLVKPLRDAGGRIVGTVGLAVVRAPEPPPDERPAAADATAPAQQRDALLRAISHDLRGPLSVINGHAQVLRRTLGDDAHAHARAGAEAILRATQHMNLMIQEIVDTARLQARPPTLRPEPVRLQTYAADLALRMGAMIDVSRVRVAIPPDLPPVIADPERLERIILNLLANALRSVPSGAAVSVRVEQRGKLARVAVHAEGAVIAPEEVPHLFEPRLRARDAPSGHRGFGLWVARTLIEAHGGRLELTSEPATGTTFAFELPLA